MNKQIERKDFLRSCARYVLAGTIGAGAVYLCQARTNPHKANTCSLPSAGCRGCGSLITCGLPRAASARKVLNHG